MNTSSIKKFLKTTMSVAGLCSVALPSAAVWTIQNGKIIDPNGQPFIFRGITVDHIAAPDKAIQAIKDAAAAGANAVQVEISTNIFSHINRPITLEQLRSVIQACKDNKVVCVLEPNDVAGYPYAFGSGSPEHSSLGFWSFEGRTAIHGQEDYVIIGMGNQALGDLPYGEYTARMQSYLSSYNSALPNFLIMIDGSGWGKDVSKEMQAFAAENIRSGGNLAKKTIYSVEMSNFSYFDTQIRDYIATFAQIGAPLVIGSFAPTPYYHPYYPQSEVEPAVQLPAASVMEYAQQYGAGYFAWNWSGSTKSGLNLTTNWDANTLTAWGEEAINGVNGIKATAKRATHFDNSSSSVSSRSSSVSSSSSFAPNNPPSAVMVADIFYQSCGSVIGVAQTSNSTDPDGDFLTYTWEVTNSGDASVFRAAGYLVQFSMEAFRDYTIKMIANDGRGGIATTSKTISHSYPACVSSSTASSLAPSKSSIATTSSTKPSSVSPSSARQSNISSLSRSSSAVTKATCSYVVGSQWANGFTAAIRVKNTGTQPLNGWSVNWQYSDGSKVTNSWNASLSGSNPYFAKNLGWNTNIQPGKTVEFGFQGSKPAGAAAIPVVTGGVCQ